MHSAGGRPTKPEQILTQEIRTAIYGCGKVAATHAAALAALPASRFVGVCDRNRTRAEEFGSRYGVPAFTDIREMVHESGAQMVSVCTPHPNHADATVAAAAAGAHVLVEKPLAADLAGCDRAIAACRSAGVKLSVMSQRRWYRPVLRVRRALDEGAIGKPILAVATLLEWRGEDYYRSDPWRGRWATEGGGVLVNQMPHLLDLLHWFMGPIDELYGYWGNFNHPQIEVEDTALAVIRFASGALGSVVASNSQDPGIHGTIHLHGDNGASIGAQTDAGSSFVSGMTARVEPPINDLWTVPGEEPRLAGWQAEDRAAAATEDPMTFYHARQIEDFLEAILRDREPAVGPEDGRSVVEMFTAIYRSRRDGAPARFPLRAEAGDDFDGRVSAAEPA
jgi:UDP-N-acetyl-2-amino-2-deoxyglucuronate dehydrogenase